MFQNQNEWNCLYVVCLCDGWLWLSMCVIVYWLLRWCIGHRGDVYFLLSVCVRECCNCWYFGVIVSVWEELVACCLHDAWLRFLLLLLLMLCCCNNYCSAFAVRVCNFWNWWYFSVLFLNKWHCLHIICAMLRCYCCCCYWWCCYNYCRSYVRFL